MIRWIAWPTNSLQELKYIRIDTIAKDKDGKPTIQRVRIVPENKAKLILFLRVPLEDLLILI